MTLVPEKNGVPDSRMVDYEREVIALGLRKAEALREVDRAQQVIATLQNDKQAIEKEIRDKMIESSKIEESNRKARADAKGDHFRQSAELAKLYEKKLEVEYQIKDEGQNLKKLVDARDVIDVSIAEKNIELRVVSESIAGKNAELAKVSGELSEAVRALESANVELQNTLRLKSNAERDTLALHNELAEVSEKVALLKQHNKEGLDLIEVFAGERRSINEDREKLNLKEKELILREEKLGKI